jgi:hypothetical protein
MKNPILAASLLAASLLAVMAFASDSKTVVCDSEGFLEAAQKAEVSRQKRRIDEATFARMASEPNTIVLDARSKEQWKQLRVKGSVNLPYTDFSAAALEKLIPARDTRVLIYCRNNLIDSKPTEKAAHELKGGIPYPDEFDPPHIAKSFAAGLNIPTFITLHIYGYTNVWELSAAVDPNNSPIQFHAPWRLRLFSSRVLNAR